MKAQNLFRMLMLMVMAFSFISCTDEDDKVEVSQLVGKWIVKEPVLPDDFVTSYTFNADKTYEVYTGSPSSNGVPLRGTYIIFRARHEGGNQAFPCGTGLLRLRAVR